MASNYTSNYNLCQWEANDKVLRTEFNADNAKIDAALKALNTSVGGKASTSALSSLQTTVNGKASKSDLSALQTAVNDKASQSDLDALKSSKADLTALNTLKSQVTTLDGDALRCVTGSYVGDGTYGSSNAKTLTFSKLPVLLIVRGETAYQYGLILPRGVTSCSCDMGSYGTGSYVHVTWNSSKKQVSWYGDLARSHMNENGKTYCYIAIY